MISVSYCGENNFLCTRSRNQGLQMRIVLHTLIYDDNYMLSDGCFKE